jgi:hypothetical protein
MSRAGGYLNPSIRVLQKPHMRESYSLIFRCYFPVPIRFDNQVFIANTLAD